MGTAQQGQPAGRVIQRLPRPDRGHGRRQTAAARIGEMRSGGGDHPDPEAWRKFGQCGIALVVEGWP